MTLISTIPKFTLVTLFINLVPIPLFSFCMSSFFALQCDGCAIFYKKDLFQLIEEHDVEFNQPGVELLNRENVAIIAKLCLKSDPSIQFLVSTTHLLYNPRREDIRLAQIQILLSELDRHAQTINSNGQKTYMPVILTGDFNLKPFSAPYTFLTNGKILIENCNKLDYFFVFQTRRH